jgi:hypothetical protein
MGALRGANLVLRFLLELAALAALATFGYWGATVNKVPMVRVTLAIVLPACVAIIWGMFISPKARIQTGTYGRAGLGLIVFLGAAIALVSRGHGTPGMVFGVLAVINATLMIVWTH